MSTSNSISKAAQARDWGSDNRKKYYADKRLSYPPDIEREPNKKYVFRV